jgi:3-methyladenine DNA glycosylase AlkD
LLIGRRFANLPHIVALDANRVANEIGSRLAGLSSQTTPAARSVRREYSRLLKEVAPDVVIRTALRLSNRDGVTCRFVAYEIVQHHKAAFTSLTLEDLLKLGTGIDGWAAVDCFACYLSGPAWRDGRLSSVVIRRWIKSADRWWRRAALVSTVALSRRGDAEDVRRVIEICALAVSDRDDMVVKALSWALRELAKKHPDEAGEFLARHRDALAARVTREVQNKIATGLKNPRRAGFS